MNTRTVLGAILVVLVVTIVIGSSAVSQSRSGDRQFASKGVVELGGSVAFQSITSVSDGQTSGTTFTTFALEPSIGYFVTDGLEIGLDPVSLTINSSTGATSSTTQLHLLGALAYNFRTEGASYPFIEGMGGFSSVSSGSVSNSGFTWGARGGVKIAIASHVLVLGGVQYMQVTENPSGATARYGYNTLLVGVGFSVWL